jgi:hypothetical protein
MSRMASLFTTFGTNIGTRNDEEALPDMVREGFF